MRIPRNLPIEDPELLCRCFTVALDTPGLVEEFDRLTGYDLARQATPIEQMIDTATSRHQEGVALFYEFVKIAVYLPMLREKRAAGK